MKEKTELSEVATVLAFWSRYLNLPGCLIEVTWISLDCNIHHYFNCGLNYASPTPQT